MTSYYLQYHNADHLDTYPTDDLDFEVSLDSLILDNSVRYNSWIYTSKKLVENAVGQFCFLIVGKTEQTKKYYLWSFFKIENYKIDDNSNYVVYGHGYDFEHPVFLNELENFNDLKKYCGNFGLGFQNIDAHPFCKTLTSFSSKSYLLEQSEKFGYFENIVLPSIQQYQSVITEGLSTKQIEILQTLYYFPESSASAKELAIALNYTSYHASNRQIGQIGRIMSQYTGIIPPTYYSKDVERPAYFLLVGPYLPHEGKKRGKKPGWEMTDNLRTALENLKLVSIDAYNSDDLLPTEIFPFDEKELLKEGKAVQVFVNRYERNQKARQECIKHYGNKCYACGFDFETTYGDIAKGFIHVHHLKQLADINKEYEVDPIRDLVPLCANCHSVIHLPKPAMTIEELKKRLLKHCIT